MAIPRHNAHMKVAKHLWDRAKVIATLEAKSMTEIVEEALATLIALRHKAKYTTKKEGKQ